MRTQDHQKPRQERIQDSQNGSKPDPLPYPCIRLRAVIISKHRLRAARDTADRQGKNLSGGIDHRHHAHAGKSLCIDKPVQPCGQHGKRCPPQVNFQVCIGIQIRSISCAEQIKHRPAEQITEQKQHHRRAKQKGKRIAQNFPRPRFLPCPSGNGKSGVPPDPNKKVNAAISVVSGNARPMPVSAILSAPGRCPI